MAAGRHGGGGGDTPDREGASEAAEAGRAAVEGLGALVQALLETIVDEGLLEDLLEVLR